MSIAAAIMYHRGCGGVLSQQSLVCNRCHETIRYGYQMADSRKRGV